jgi:predicted acyltransferase
MSSTYLTSTLLGVLAGLVGGGRPEGLSRSIGALVAVVVGALAGGILAKSARAWLPVAVLLPLAVVVVGSAVTSRPDRPT